MAELNIWQVISQRTLHDGSPWLKLSTEHVRLPNGVEIPDFYRIEMRPYVAIFALTGDQQVALIEHYKHGPQQISLELPAGYIETGDDPLSAARRELREETGLASDQWQEIGRFFIDGNRGCGWIYGFLAREAYSVGSPQLEDTELITLHLKPLNEVYDLWRTDQISNAPIMGLIGRALLEIGYLRITNE